MPIRLSEQELQTVLDAAHPLPRDLQGAFLSAVANALQGREIGPGLVARTCREVQRHFHFPPADRGPGTLPKYR